MSRQNPQGKTPGDLSADGEKLARTATTANTATFPQDADAESVRSNPPNARAEPAARRPFPFMLASVLSIILWGAIILLFLWLF